MHRAACIVSICVLCNEADAAQNNPGPFFDPLPEQLSWVADVQPMSAAAEEAKKASPPVDVGVEGVIAQVPQRGARREYRQEPATVR